MLPAMTEYVRTDLHGHTFFSDGRASPEEYVDTRAEHGIPVIALSDHDTLAGIPRAAARAREKGLTLIPAMETTSFIHFGTDDAEQIHVLAYFPPQSAFDGSLEKKFLYQRSLRVHERWRQFVLEWAEGLSDEEKGALDPEGSFGKQQGVEFPGLMTLIHRITEYEPTGADDDVARAHAFAEARAPLFRKFHKHHVKFWTEDKDLFGWSPEEMIDAIRADGARDVVAHANRIRDKARMDEVLAYASGVEVYTSRHTKEVSERFLTFARESDKHWTASTDDHQHAPYFPPPSGTPKRTVDWILQR